MTPLFSIIVPAYNREKYIQKAINSILNQKIKDVEVIIINDGSTDNTLAIAKEYSRLNENIIIIDHKKNESQHISRIEGVLAAKGQYILFLDSDDCIKENAFSLIERIIRNKPGYDIYEFGYTEKPSNKNVFPFKNSDKKFINYFNLYNRPAHMVWNKAYNTKMLKLAFSQMDKIYISSSEDLYESIIIAYYSKRNLQIKKPILYYSIGTGISTTAKSYEQIIELIDSTKKVFDSTQNFLNKHNLNIDTKDLNYTYIDYLFDKYIDPQVNIQTKTNLHSTMIEYFGKELILSYGLYSRSILYQERLSFKNSKAYKLTYIILTLYRKIKYFPKVFQKQQQR